MMSFNNSTSFEDVINTVNFTVSIILFVAIFPIAILYGICILALLCAKNINCQMRVLLINIFIAHLCGVLLPLFLPADHNAIACKISFSLAFIGYLTNLTSTTLFSIMVYLFIKYDNNKLKWYIIIPSITVSWMASILFGTLIFADPMFIFFEERYCSVSSESLLFIPYFVLAWLTEAVLLIVMLVFGIFTVRFVRRRILHDTAEDQKSKSNLKIKRAIVKVLIYLVIECFMDVISNLLPSLLPLFVSSIDDFDAISSTVSQLVHTFVTTILSVLTPILMIAILKPVRDALKHAKGKMCVPFGEREIPAI